MRPRSNQLVSALLNFNKQFYTFKNALRDHVNLRKNNTKPFKFKHTSEHIMSIVPNQSSVNVYVLEQMLNYICYSLRISICRKNNSIILSKFIANINLKPFTDLTP